MHAYSITLVRKDLSPSPLSVCLSTTDLFISRSGKTGWFVGMFFFFFFFFLQQHSVHVRRIFVATIMFFFPNDE